MFATEHFGFMPDLMTMAKGLSSGYAPIAATAVRESLFADFQEQKEIALGHLLTFGGHAAAAAAAIKNIEIMQAENLAANAAERGAYLISRLEALRAHPTVGDVRGIGLLCGIELVKNKETKQKFGRDSAFIKRLGQLLLERGSSPASGTSSTSRRPSSSRPQ